MFFLFRSGVGFFAGVNERCYLALGHFDFNGFGFGLFVLGQMHLQDAVFELSVDVAGVGEL